MSTNVVMPKITTYSDLPTDVLEIITRMKIELEHKDVMTELKERVIPYQPISKQEFGSWNEFMEFNPNVITRTRLNRLIPSGGGWSWSTATNRGVFEADTIPEIYEERQYFDSDERYVVYYMEEYQVDQFLEDGEDFDDHLYEIALTNWVPADFDHNDDNDVTRLINIARVECKYATMI